MSILIKGMSKPTDCGLCPFEDFGYCNVKGERNTSEVGVDADCPLIEEADQTEPQTDEEYINNMPWTEVGNGEQTDDTYFLNLIGAVERGEISDAGANQAWYEYINHKDEPQTDCPWK